MDENDLTQNFEKEVEIGQTASIQKSPRVFLGEIKSLLLKKKIVLFLLIGVIVLLILGALVNYFKGLPKGRPWTTPSVTPTPTQIPQTYLPPTLKDPELNTIYQDIRNIDKELETVDLKEDGLSFPILDFNVSF